MWMWAGVCSSSAKSPVMLPLNAGGRRILQFFNGIVCLHCRSLYQTWRMENRTSTQRCLEREEVPSNWMGKDFRFVTFKTDKFDFFWLEIKGNITALPTGGACMHCRSVFKEPKLISSRVFVLLSMETVVLWNDAIIISFFFFFTCAGFIEVSLQQQWLCLQRMLITLVWSHTDRARTRMGLICNSSSDHVCNTIWLIYYSFPDYSSHIEMVKISEKLHDRVKGPVLFSNNNSFKRNIFLQEAVNNRLNMLGYFFLNNLSIHFFQFFVKSSSTGTRDQNRHVNLNRIWNT